MTHVRISPRVIERINAMRRERLSTARRELLSAPPPPPPHSGKLQDQLNQLRNIDYALIERRIMEYIAR